MSVYNKTTEINISDLTVINPALFKEIESLIQDLKNNQRCFAEAASLVNSSQLRNVFATIELERTIFMAAIAKAINRGDLILGEVGYDADVSWFPSVMINNVSENEFDFEVLSLCIQCEESTYQAYKRVMTLRAKEKIFVILDKHKLKLERTAQQLQTLYCNFQA